MSALPLPKRGDNDLNFFHFIPRASEPELAAEWPFTNIFSRFLVARKGYPIAVFIISWRLNAQKRCQQRVNMTLPEKGQMGT